MASIQNSLDMVIDELIAVRNRVNIDSPLTPFGEALHQLVKQLAYTNDHSFNEFERLRRTARRVLNGTSSPTGRFPTDPPLQNIPAQAGVGAPAKTEAVQITREDVIRKLHAHGVVTRTAEDFKQLVDDILKYTSWA